MPERGSLSSFKIVVDERTSRARRTTQQAKLDGQHPIGTPERNLPTNTGPLASAKWLIDRGLSTSDPRWFVEVGLEVPGADTRLQLDVYAEEWGIQLQHEGRASWIRVTDVAFVHGRDEHGLIFRVPRLANIGTFIAQLERDLGVQFDRATPRIRSSIPDAYSIIREWIAGL